MALESTWVAALGWALLDFLWQGAAVGLAAALLLAALREGRPQARYAVACRRWHCGAASGCGVRCSSPPVRARCPPSTPHGRAVCPIGARRGRLRLARSLQHNCRGVAAWSAGTSLLALPCSLALAGSPPRRARACPIRGGKAASETAVTSACDAVRCGFHALDTRAPVGESDGAGAGGAARAHSDRLPKRARARTRARRRRDTGQPHAGSGRDLAVYHRRVVAVEARPGRARADRRRLASRAIGDLAAGACPAALDIPARQPIQARRACRARPASPSRPTEFPHVRIHARAPRSTRPTVSRPPCRMRARPGRARRRPRHAPLPAVASVPPSPGPALVRPHSHRDHARPRPTPSCWPRPSPRPLPCPRPRTSPRQRLPSRRRRNRRRPGAVRRAPLTAADAISPTRWCGVEDG